MDDNKTQELLSDNMKYAIVGASNNMEKYGAKVYARLKQLGYVVYPINPREELVQGDKAYENLYQLPEQVDVLNFVVPPDIALKVTQTALDIGYKNFWYQPGSYNKEIIELHKQMGTTAITDQCILIETQDRALMD